MKKAAIDKITDQIINKMEEGVIPWRKSWRSLGVPSNPLTGNEYNGLNRLILQMFGGGKFLTYKQAEKMGGQVKKGSKGIYLCKYGTFEKENEKGEVSKLPYLSAFSVFSVRDIEGLEHLNETQKDKIVPTIEDCHSFIESIDHKVENGEPAYSAIKDKVYMPAIGQFDSSEEYYSTYFHELIHWTGHGSRLSRELKSFRCSKTSYSKEELVAEMGAAFMCDRFGIEGTLDNSAAYLQSWLNVIKADKRLLMAASSKAYQAAEYLEQQAIDNKLAA